MLSEAERKKEIHGIKISRYCPVVSHLLFADDSYFFCNATPNECHNIRNLLGHYEEASGQQVNLEKSSVFFSKNTPLRLRTRLARILNIQRIGTQDKYLGLPAEVQKSKKQTFAEIKDKVAAKLKGWKEKHLSHSGKEVFIKSVATAIPVYSMACFKLPASLCKEINQMIARFWWGQKDNERKMHWVSWSKLCKTKQEGGLGFRDLEAFNLSLLAKQGWRLLKCQNTLFFRIFKGKYFPFSSFDRASIGSNPSWGWRSIMQGKKLLDLGMRWRVGSGRFIDCAKDPWIPGSFPFTPSLSHPLPSEITQVHHLIDWNNCSWKQSLISSHFQRDTASNILKIPISPSQPLNVLIWHCSKDGNYSIKSGYNLASSSLQYLRGSSSNLNPASSFQSDPTWNLIWNLRIPNKLKTFLWRALSNSLAVDYNISRMLQNHDPTCKLCGNCPETQLHLFSSCDKSRQVWLVSPLGIRSNLIPGNSFSDWWKYLYSHLSQSSNDHHISSVCFILWRLWKARNDFIFNEKNWSVSDILSKAAAQQREFEIVWSSLHNIQPVIRSCPLAATSWVCPPQGWIKINFDGAFSGVNSSGAFGILARDSSGKILHANAIFIPLTLNAESVETLALKEAVILAQSFLPNRIIIEGDAKLLIESMQRRCFDFSKAHIILQDAAHLVLNPNLISFEFASRVCNWAAHNLAHKALSSCRNYDNNDSIIRWVRDHLEDTISSHFY